MQRKFQLLIFATLLMAFFKLSAQDTIPVNDSIVQLETEARAAAEALNQIKQAEKEAKKVEKEAKKVEKEVKKAEKEVKKAEKAQKKAERALKQQAKLTKAILTRKRAIGKKESRMIKLQGRMAKNKSKGMLSPVDEMKMNKKIGKLKLGISKDKGKLAKLERKQ